MDKWFFYIESGPRYKEVSFFVVRTSNTDAAAAAVLFLFSTHFFHCSTQGNASAANASGA